MLKSEIGLQMAELAHIEKIQKSADFWGSKSEENINSHFQKKNWTFQMMMRRTHENKYTIFEGWWWERDSTEIYIRIDTNTNSPNYYEDKEVESKSNKRIYHN